MEQKGITNQLFASSTLSIVQEVPEVESKNAPNQLCAPPSSINIKHEVDSRSPACETENFSKDISGYNIESTCTKSEHMCLPFVDDTKDHFKVESILEDTNSDNLLKSDVNVSTESNVTEPTTSGICRVKTEKFHDDDVGTNTGYETQSSTTKQFAQYDWSNTKEQRDLSAIDNILPEHLEKKLVELAGCILVGEDGKYKNSVNFQHSNKKTYKCDLCQKAFSHWSNMRRHQSTHIKEKPFQCETCQKSFSQSGSMKRHKLTHTKEKTFQCEICEKSFSQKSHLNTHCQSVHSDIRPYQCGICQKSFSLKKTVMRHRLTHTLEKSFQCDICQKSFSQKWYLNHHNQSVHGNKGLYQCDICHKSFLLKQHMLRHKLTHTKEKSFQCDICQKSFSQKQNMMTHKLTHIGDKQFQCDICEKSFSRKSNLNTHHQNVHHDVRPH